MVLLPVIEKALQFLKSTLIRHDQEELTLQLFLSVLLVFKSVLGGNIVKFEFTKPLKSLDLPHSVDEILYRTDSFKYQGLFRLETKGVILQN
ncbi:hypothetical protein DSCOOX_30860 [Desulfosarcina ovata subsp. ovata]|uniref:Uncharacterized protein n=1 Tax=Desulfosarcina ovata subsp. ovata TaxID=2752305 RepID=A0A5K8ABM1_9BACT|nr:hypothetical protein DSCOOX_30860 [Desulfosarcina ovata subsp. ovata]